MSSMFCVKIYSCKNADWCARDYNPKSVEPKCFEQLTNADRIRAMTDEEIFAFILGIHSLTTDRYGDPDYRLVVNGQEFRDDESLMKWLKSPVEEAL